MKRAFLSRSTLKIPPSLRLREPRSSLITPQAGRPCIQGTHASTFF
jgi:hypothetical protein